MKNICDAPFNAVAGQECYWAIQGALDTGDDVYIPGQTNGTPYYIGNYVKATHSNQLVFGDGYESRIVSTAGPTVDIFQVGDGSAVINNFGMRDLALWTAAQKTAGIALRLMFAARHSLRNVGIGTLDDVSAYGNLLYRGVHFDRFDNCSIEGGSIICQEDAIRANGNADQSWGAGLWVSGGLRIVSGTNGIHLAGSCGGVEIDDVDISQCGAALRIDITSSGIRNREIFISSNTSLDGCGTGLFSAANSYGFLNLDGTWVASHRDYGIYLDGPQYSSSIFKMVGATIFNNTGTALVLQSGIPSYLLCANTFSGNGTNLTNNAGTSAVQLIRSNIGIADS